MILQRRLAALLAAETLAEMFGLPGHCHPLKGDHAGQYAVHVWQPYRLIFEPAMDPIPRTPDGSIDVKAVTMIRILEVVDYHGD